MGIVNPRAIPKSIWTGNWHNQKLSAFISLLRSIKATKYFFSSIFFGTLSSIFVEIHFFLLKHTHSTMVHLAFLIVFMAILKLTREELHKKNYYAQHPLSFHTEFQECTIFIGALHSFSKVKAIACFVAKQLSDFCFY